MKKSLILLAIAVFGIKVNAQQVTAHCGTDEYVEELIEQNPGLGEIFEQRKSNLMNIAATNAASPSKKGTQAAVLTIPVVFHIVYESDEDNISKAQILDGLRILNEDFNLQNPDAGNLRSIFQSVQADVEVEFALAKIDDQGNCSDGINRIQSSLSVSANPRDQVKSLVQWDPERYLNIWVVRSILNNSSTTGIILGYANFPWMPASTDGIVIRHDALGLVGTAAYDGRTLTHEVGHYLGLLHTFQDGCGQGDGIADTPPVASASNGCNLNKNSCSNDSPNYPDMIENFMDYSDGECQNTFTTLQKNAMRSTLTSAQYRSVLVSNANQIITGIINPPACQPLALFDIVNPNICEGESVSFEDQTEDGTPDTYLWTFPGGTPSTSSDPNPTVNYPLGGTYDVTLTVSNAAGNSTITKQHSVGVKSLYNNHAEWREDFENPVLNKPELTVLSGDEIEFELSSQAARNGAQSLILENNSAGSTGDIDEFISPSIQTIFGSNLTLNFDFAFAKKATSNSDILAVYVSTDCGKTWLTVRILGGTLLTTAGNVPSGDFIPAASEWKTFSANLDQYQSEGPILIKLSFRGGGGNNLYIDNINFSADNIGLDEVELGQNLSVYPNPSNGELNIDLQHLMDSDLNLAIYDLYGKEVGRYTIPKNTSKFNIPTMDIAAGVYVLNFTNGTFTHSKKLIVE